ncbi:LysR family transcriptional regulator [Rhodovibrionaceae bacterium A322]
MSKLEIRHLRALVAIRRSGSVSDAARQMGLTQSAVSHQLRELERRFDLPLFERINRKLRLTPQGDQLLASAEVILEELDKVERELTPQQQDEASLLRIGAYAYGCYHWLPTFLKDLKADFPRLDFELATESRVQPPQSLQAGDIDLGLAAGRINQTGMTVTPLFEDDLVAVLPPGHPLCDKDWLVAEDFSDVPYVTYSAVTEKGFEMDLLWRPADVHPRKTIRAGLTDAVIELVKADFGISVLSRWAVRDSEAKGEVVCRPLTPQGMTLPWWALTRKSDSREAVVAAHVAQLLALWCREHLAPHSRA